MPKRKRKKEDGSKKEVKYKGVQKTMYGRFQARIFIDGKKQGLGTFETEEKAARAYDRAAMQAGRQPTTLNYQDKVPMDYQPKMKKLRSDNTIGYRGVVKRRNRFQAYITIGGTCKSQNIGRFGTAKEAAIAYDLAATATDLGIPCSSGSPCTEENDRCPAVIMPNTVSDTYGYVGNNEKCHWSYGAASKVKREWMSITDGYRSGVIWNGHFWYHANRPNARGRVRLGVWGSGSNSHMETQTSNYGTGLGLDTKGPDDPSTGYVSNPTTYQSRGTTWAAPGESTVGLYVRRKIVRNEDCTERHVSAKAPEENVVLEKVLVAKIGTTDKWKYEFAGWTQTGHLFDDGNCATEDVECKLTAFDDLQVKHGLVLESGDTFRVHVHNPLNDPTKTLREIFADVEDQTAVAFGTVRVNDWTAFGVVGEKTQSDITIGTFTIKAMMVSASSSDEYALLGGAQARLEGGSKVQTNCAGMSSMDADAYQDVCMAWSSHFFYGKGLGADDCIGDVRLGRWGTGSNGHSRTWMANYCTGLGCRTKGPDDPSTTGYVSSATTYKEQGSTWIAPGKLTTSVYVLREVAAGTVKKATEASCGATTCVADATVLNAAGNPTCTVEDGACYCRPGFTGCTE